MVNAGSPGSVEALFDRGGEFETRNYGNCQSYIAKGLDSSFDSPKVAKEQNPAEAAGEHYLICPSLR